MKKTPDEVKARQRARQYAAKVRREAIDNYKELFPEKSAQIEVAEITGGLVLAAGQLIRQYCPEEWQGSAAEVLYYWMREGLTSVRFEEPDITEVEPANDSVN